MKIILRFVLILIAVGLIFVFGFGYGRWYSTRRPASKGERKVLYYVDAMHPWYKSDKPGTAPDCGMKLEPVYSSGDGHGDETNTAPANFLPAVSAEIRKRRSA